MTLMGVVFVYADRPLVTVLCLMVVLEKSQTERRLSTRAGALIIAITWL